MASEIKVPVDTSTVMFDGRRVTLLEAKIFFLVEHWRPARAYEVCYRYSDRHRWLDNPLYGRGRRCVG